MLYDDLADFYDGITKPKDYASEVEFLVKAFKRFAKRRVQRVLDVCCGTGNHARLLASRGYDVTGVDLSRSMLATARRKAPRVKFLRRDMRRLRLGRRFDAITCMYGSIGYCRGHEELKRVLMGFHKHLEYGGVLVFDAFLKRLLSNGSCWIDHGKSGALDITSVSTTILDEEKALFRWIFLVKERGKLDVIFDEHRLALFDEGRLKNLLRETGFRPGVFKGFPDGHQPRTVTLVAVRGK